jgi:hypothetical protein
MTSSMVTASSTPAALAASEEIPETGLVNSRFGIVNFGCEKTPFLGVFFSGSQNLYDQAIDSESVSEPLSVFVRLRR